MERAERESNTKKKNEKKEGKETHTTWCRDSVGNKKEERKEAKGRVSVGIDLRFLFISVAPDLDFQIAFFSP